MQIPEFRINFEDFLHNILLNLELRDVATENLALLKVRDKVCDLCDEQNGKQKESSYVLQIHPHKQQHNNSGKRRPRSCAEALSHVAFRSPEG